MKTSLTHMLLACAILLFACGCAQQKVAEPVIPTVTTPPAPAGTLMVSPPATGYVKWSCTDSDAFDKYVKGTVESDYQDKQKEYYDSCADEYTVKEWSCTAIGMPATRLMTCDEGFPCLDGACTKAATIAPASTAPSTSSTTTAPQPATTSTIPSSDAKTPYVKLAVKLPKETYRSGETMAIEVFAESGEKLENVEMRLYGIYAGYYRLNRTSTVALAAGKSVVPFAYVAPPCNTCAGISAGNYVIIAEAAYAGKVVAKDVKDVKLQQ